MPKYLYQASYTLEGLKGLLKEGGSSRRGAVAKAIESLGGKMEAFYFAFGDVDVFVVAEMPDNVSAAAMAVIASAAGTSKVKTAVLMTPEEADQVAKKSVDYRPPGE